MNRIDDIKKRNKERRREYRPESNRPPSRNSETPPRSSGTHPLFKSHIFVLKCLLAACLVLLSGLLYKSHTAAYPKVKDAIQYTLSQDMNFAKVSTWYEKAFGQPMAFFPIGGKKEEKKPVANDIKGSDYAIPVTGTVTQKFSTKNKGVIVKTDANAPIEAIASGFVVSVGKKDGIGETVVIQHSDGSESWYGKLKSVDVKEYESVKRSQKVGVASPVEGQSYGTFYFAYKEGDHFVNPILVTSFD